MFLIATGAVVVGWLVYVYLFVGRRGKSFPPGPPTLPLIGNLHQIPKTGAHIQFAKWAAQYGGIYSLQLGPSSTLIVLTSRRLVKSLIDRKSSIYSNRPPSYVSHDLITRGDHLLVMTMGETWRLFRKLVHQQFMESAVEREALGVVEAEARGMVWDFLQKPEEFMDHPKRFSNSIIMSLVFGIRTPTYATPHASRLYDIMERWSRVMETGATPPVEIFPFLKWIPESVFGNWITRSRDVGARMDRLYGEMIRKVIDRRSASGSRGSFMDRVLDQQEKLHLTDNQLNFLGGVLMEGGSDTSSSIILAAVHAMVKFPAVQRKAHGEIDGALGDDRSPTWADRERLKYVGQVVKETMRWRPVTPLAFPHALAEDDWVDGHFLPKGSTVLINVWGLHHDPATAPEPDEFNPERFEGRHLLAPEYAASADYENRDHYGYGSGRRICPGIHLAERNLFLGIAKLLWAFEFSAPEGVEIDVDDETAYSEGFLHCPKPFPCVVRVRGEGRRETILREFGEAGEVFARFEG